MFNLESAIAVWRQQMVAAGLKNLSTLDELESHLREEIERLTQSGLDRRQAFETGVQQVGRARALKNEFKKTDPISIALSRLMLVICVGFYGFIIFLCAATVGMCFSTWTDRLMASISMAATLLVAGGWIRIVPRLPVIASTRRRWLAALSCFAGGIGAATFFCGVILPHFEVRDSHQIPAIAFWAAFLIAAFWCLGLGLLMNGPERESLDFKKSPPQTAVTGS